MLTPNGGVFGRNPKFNNVTVEGDLVSTGGMTVTPNANAPTSNIAIGPSAGAAMTTTTDDSIAIGRNAFLLGTGDNNICIGALSGDAIGTASGCVAIGVSAFSAQQNNVGVAIGPSAGATSTGDSCTFVGNQAGNGIGSSSSNTCVGHVAGSAGIGSFNTYIGAFSGDAAGASSERSTGVGYAALFSQGSGNTAIGSSAGYRRADGTVGTGCFDSVFVGQDSRPAGDSQSNQIVIGSAARGDGSNTTVIGNTSTVSTRIAGTATSLFAISGDTMRITGTRTPASNAAGTAGDFTFGTDGATTYLYYCIANGNWGRVALTTGY